MPEYLDLVLKADYYAEFMDLSKTWELRPKINGSCSEYTRCFRGNRRAGFELTREECHLAVLDFDIAG